MPWTHLRFWVTPLVIAAILAILAGIVARTRLAAIYRERFAESRRERLFLASVGFFISAGVVRGITLAIHDNVGPFHNISIHGRHIHHLVWGILLLLLVGYSWLIQVGTGTANASAWMGRLTSLLYGVAAALTLDEFALWLNLEDVYWERQGRESYEAMALFGGVLAIGILGAPFFKGIWRELGRTFGRKKTPRDKVAKRL